jgi:pulcherriminic acid synthase
MPVTTPDPPTIISDAHKADPDSTYKVLRDHYPVLWDEPTNSFLVSRHEDIMWVLKNPAEITSDNYTGHIEPVHGRTILTLEGKEHSLHRRLLTPFFHRGGLEGFGPTIEHCAQMLTDPWLKSEAEAVAIGKKERGEVDLVKQFIHHYPISVIEEMLALPREDHASFESWYGAIMEFIDNLAGEDGPKERGLQARAEMTEYFLPLIRQRRAGEGSDLLTMMCQADVAGEQLTDEEVRAFISLMITAGGETADQALGSMFQNLIVNRDQLDAVYENPELIVDAFAETLRHSPPVHIAGRQPIVDIELQGVKIPKGSTLTLLLASGSRDPRKFDEPDQFDIFRTDNDTDRAFSAAADHLGFANGRHFCVGAMLAKKEVLTGGRLLLSKMQDLRFAEGFEPQPHGLFTRGLDSLRVTYLPA